MQTSDHCSPPPLASLPPTGRKSGGEGDGGGESKTVSTVEQKEYRRLLMVARRAEATGKADADDRRAAFEDYSAKMKGPVGPRYE